MTDSLMVRDVDIQLKSIHDCFEENKRGKISGIKPWSTLYKESFLWNKFRIHNSHWMYHIYERSVSFPEIHSILQIIRSSLEQPLAVSAPPLIQEGLYKLARLALQIRLYGKEEDREVYARMATSLVCTPPTLRYYIEAVEAHAKFANYLLYGNPQNKKLENILHIVSDISSCPVGGVRHLEKFQSLDLSYVQPAHKEALELIRQDEGQHVEFKSCFLSSNPKRCYNKNKLDEQRITSIVAFLNSNGGNLFLGVDDDMSIHGIEEELEIYHNGSEDQFVRRLTALIRDKISVCTRDSSNSQPISKPNELTSIKSIFIYGHTVIWIKVAKSQRHLFFFRDEKGNQHFYVRTDRNKQKITSENIKKYNELRDDAL